MTGKSKATDGAARSQLVERIAEVLMTHPLSDAPKEMADDFRALAEAVVAALPPPTGEPNRIAQMVALLKEAADFVQPFPRASDLLDRIEAALAAPPQVEPAEGERGADANWQTLKPCEKHPDRYCNCEGFYPACRQAPASTASKAAQS